LPVVDFVHDAEQPAGDSPERPCCPSYLVHIPNAGPKRGALHRVMTLTFAAVGLTCAHWYEIITGRGMFDIVWAGLSIG
jgi:hypothetical protein